MKMNIKLLYIIGFSLSGIGLLGNFIAYSLTWYPNFQCPLVVLIALMIVPIASLLPVLLSRLLLKDFRFFINSSGVFTMSFVFVLFFLTVVSWMYLANVSNGGVVDCINGQFVLHNHGKVIQLLNKSEYLYYRALENRCIFLSGMSFCAVGFLEYWLRLFAKHTKNVQLRCSDGVRAP